MREKRLARLAVLLFAAFLIYIVAPHCFTMAIASSEDQVELVSYSYKVLERKYGDVRYSWKVVVHNHADQPASVSVMMSFIDHQDYEVFKEITTKLIRRNTRSTISSSEIRPENQWRQVKKATAEIINVYFER